MQLMPADDFEKIKAKYIEVIEHTPGMEQYARWVYGQHPTDELLQAHLRNNEMYVLMDQENIAGMTAVVMHQERDYEAVPWAEMLVNDEAAVLHLLAVCPEYRGKQLGRVILEKAVDLAFKNGKKALRLDTLQSHLPAQRMYERSGFSYRGKQHLYAGNTGWTDFLYYEKLLMRDEGR